MEEIFDFIDDKIDKTTFAAKFTPQMCEFEEKCEYTFKYLPHVVHQFQWFGLNTVTERTSALQHLGYMLLRELDNMQEVYAIRKLQFCDEHCDKFQDWLCLIDNKLKKYCQFADEAEEVLNNACWDFAKRRLLLRLNQTSKWMEDAVTAKNMLERSSDKCNDLNLHYDPDNLVGESDGTRKFFYLILHFLALLAVPSHKDITDRELVSLFRNSFDMFKNSNLGKNILEKYAYSLRDELTGLNDEQQLETVRRNKLKLTAEIRESLEKFDVDYCGIDKEKNASRLCRQLYERLNGIHGDEEKEHETGCDARPKRMTNKDLRSYFAKEVHMQFLIGKINELNEVIDVSKKPERRRKNEPDKKSAAQAEAKKNSWSGIFIVDENKLAICFGKLYNIYFGEKRKYQLEGKHDQSLFFAYLYLLVEKEQLGKENFAENTRKPFFEFIKEKVVRETDKTMRTFHNRVEDLQKFRENLLSKDEKMRENTAWRNSTHYKNFHGISGNFHKTSYFNELERLKKK